MWMFTTKIAVYQQVNTNGVISFLAQVDQYTSDPFPLGDGRRLIAPYWADVDTDEGGHVMYRETTDSSILQRATTDITAVFPYLPGFRATWVFIASWHEVAYFGARSHKRNTFQSVLVSDGRHSFAIFNYGNITWTTGTASDGNAYTGLGGTPAKVGFNAGDGIQFFCTDASQTEDIVNVETTSNVNTPGRWVFRIDSAAIRDGGCNTDGPITVFPFFGTMLGGTKVSISGPCFNDPSVNIWCKFGNQDPVRGWLDSNTTAVCISPFLGAPGRIPLALSTDDGNTYEHHAVYRSVDPGQLVADVEITENTDETITIEWYPDDVDGNTVNVNLHGLDETTGTWNTFAQLASGISNTGSYTISTADSGWITVAVVKTGAISVVSGNVQARVLYGAIGTYLAVKAIAPTLCESWHRNDRQLPDFLEELSRDFPCPRTLNQARGDTGSFQADPACFAESSSPSNCFFHPGAHHCVRSIGQTSRGAGQQCCYKTDGSLLLDGPGRGTPDRVRTSSILRHFRADVYPWIVCCKLSNNCDLYFELRPANDGTGYVFPRPAWTFGDPHFITLDGLSYTFNGAGEFLLVDMNNGEFSLQARMEQLVNDGTAVGATILTALVMRENSSETVQVQLSEVRTMDIRVDGELQDFQGLTVQEFNGSVVTVETAIEARVSFNSGIGVAVRAEEDMLSIAVTLPLRFRGKTVGLLGKWNADPADDLTTPGGVAVPANSSIQDIHNQFGLLWMIDEEDSIFTYGPGESYSSITDADFTPTFELPSVEPEVQAAAEDVCGSDNEACLFDVLTTGRLAVANVSIRAVQEYTEQIEELLTCGVLDPPDVPGTLVMSNNNSIGSVATFECEYGVLATPWERVCQQDGIWSDVPPPDCVFPPGGCYVLHPTFPVDNFAIYDNRCHWFSRAIDRTDYATAEQFCESGGGRLVTVKDSAKQEWLEDYINNNLPRRNYWIGLKDRHNEASFMWSDDTAFNNGDYSNWHQRDNPPKHHKKRDCVIIHRARKEWAVVNCNKKRNRFICEMVNTVG
ncbi:SUSD2 [Branchiostoma lanceolatum]|uniref:SUSD2 protein n=1 Tax=Branchiostoma lanceolatum TaxID=7740 RepID=A0A8K0AAS3_BRALA|nr:SUSD2 [Branchiostoma lanceolatum]